MASSFADALKSDDLRSRVAWVFIGLAIFVLTVHIGMPGVNKDVWNALLNKGELFRFLGMFTGGALNNFSVAAMGITPYINASIIMQLLTVVLPQLKDLQKEGGEQGRKQIGAYTRQLTLGLAVLQALFMTVALARYSGGGGGVFTMTGFGFYAMVVIALVTGTMFLMWLGELINENGIGNGISLIIFGGIVARVPSAIMSAYSNYKSGAISLVGIFLFLAFAVLVIIVIIEIQQGQRRIPVQYAKRVVGRKMYGGQSTHIPLKVNQAGVIPVIFGMSLLQLPQTLVYFWPNTGFSEFMTKWLSTNGTPGVYVYSLFYAILIIFFTYFYTAVTFNPMEVADNMKANGGFVPGIRPGRPTVEYLQKVMNRITFTGAIFLAVIAIMPLIIGNFTAIDFKFGGTSLLIAVGVALDTMKQLENQMVMRNYQGFLK